MAKRKQKEKTKLRPDVNETAHRPARRSRGWSFSSAAQSLKDDRNPCSPAARRTRSSSRWNPTSAPHRVSPTDWVTPRDIYRRTINAELFARKIGEARAPSSTGSGSPSPAAIWSRTRSRSRTGGGSQSPARRRWLADSTPVCADGSRNSASRTRPIGTILCLTDSGGNKCSHKHLELAE